MKITQSREVCGKVAAIFAVLMMLALVARGQAPNAIQVNAGESVTLAVQDVDKLAVADPLVADVISLSDKEANIIGKKAGVTTLTVVHKDDKPTLVYRIEVGNDTMAATVRRIIDQPGVIVKSVGDSIVLDGQVEDELQAQRANKVATAYSPKVVSLLEVRKPRQIRIRTRILEVNKDKTRNIGIKYFGDNGQVQYGFGRVEISEGVTGIASGHSFLDPTQVSGQNISPGQIPIGVKAALDLLITKNYARLLSEPTLVTLSGQEASFLVGQEVPITQQLPNSFTVQFKEVGVRMNIKPTADSQGRINTVIHAEVSQIVRFITGSFGSQPIIGTKKADTTLQLGDGETMVLGGLLENNLSTDALRKVPWLGDIPVLGLLFRSKEFQQNQSEILFFLTTEIVKNAEADAKNAAQTPLMKDWNSKGSGKDLLKTPDKKEDWSLDNPGRMGLPEWKLPPATPTPPPAPSVPPTTNFTPARPAGQE